VTWCSPKPWRFESRSQDQRHGDILAAIGDIKGYLSDSDLDDGRTYAACRLALIEIGEAARHLDKPLLDVVASEVDWGAVIRMRNFLVHHYFDTDHAVVSHVVQPDLTCLRAAVKRLQQQVTTRAEPPSAIEPPPNPPVGS
jgi:uncharacterized protein with HEPN domain